MKTLQFCLLAFAFVTTACGGEAEPVTTTTPSQLEEVAVGPVPRDDDTATVPTLDPSTAIVPAAPVSDAVPPVEQPPAEEPPVTAPPSTEEPMPPAMEPPSTTPPPAEPTPSTPPPAEPTPSTPPPAEPTPSTPPPAEPTPSTPPPAQPPPVTPPAPDPTPATPAPVDPNAGWTAIPRGTRRSTFPQGQTGPGTTGSAFTISIPAARVYRIKYEVLPEGNFDFRAGGKLPGLGGGSTPAGGSQATDGYSGRLMWNYGGRLSFYFYRVTGGVGGIDTGGYGTHWMWAADAKLKPGQWNTIEIAVDMNTGLTIGYLNGVEKGRQSLNYLWNTTDKIVFSAFFGGQGASYAPSKNEAMSFRNMAVKAGN